MNEYIKSMRKYIGHERNSLDSAKPFDIQPVDPYREFVDRQIAESWAGPYVISKGFLHDTRTQGGFTALEDGAVIGYILYNIVDSDCEITVLESIHEGRGVGRALINAVQQIAEKKNCRRLWLVTTNDNTHAIRFYQRLGFSLHAVHINSLKNAREIKPRIPPTGNDNIPILHEFEFELLLPVDE